MKSTELLHAQTNASEDPNREASSEILQRKQIKNTPFWLIKENDKYYGVLGKYRVTEQRDNEDEVTEEIYDAGWDILLKVIAIFVEATKEQVEEMRPQTGA